jgi:Uma2 family endonuclease
MSTVPSKLLTEEEYLARERAAEFKSEFYRGEMFAMSGANARHNLICINLIAASNAVARARGCRVFGSDMRVKVADTGLYTYPDVSIACGKLEFKDEHQDVLLNPCSIFEVLSKTTERRDRGWKFDRYCELPSLVSYVIVSQDKPLVEHFIRQSDGEWRLERPKGLDAELYLPVLDCKLALRVIYADIEFDPEGEEVPPPIEPSPS